MNSSIEILGLLLRTQVGSPFEGKDVVSVAEPGIVVVAGPALSSMPVDLELQTVEPLITPARGSTEEECEALRRKHVRIQEERQSSSRLQARDQEERDFREKTKRDAGEGRGLIIASYWWSANF